jgi:hypothetical protein
MFRSSGRTNALGRVIS